MTNSIAILQAPVLEAKYFGFIVIFFAILYSYY